MADDQSSSSKREKKLREERDKKEKKEREEKEKKEREEKEKKEKKEKKERESKEKKERKEKEKQERSSRSGSISAAIAVPPLLRPATNLPSALSEQQSERSSGSSSSHRAVPPPKLSDSQQNGGSRTLARAPSIRRDTDSTTPPATLAISSPLESSQTRVLAVPPPMKPYGAVAPPSTVVASIPPPALSASTVVSQTPPSKKPSVPIPEVECDYNCKVIFTGEVAVGKSSISLRLKEDKFSDSYQATIGVEFISVVHKSNSDGKTMKAQIWDTSGQERFHAITSVYFRGASGVVVVFDQSNAKSYESISTMIGTAQYHCGTDRPSAQPLVMVLGNKSDILPSVVDMDAAEQWCKAQGYVFYRTSAKTGQNIRKAFHEFLQMIYDYRVHRNSVGTGTSQPGSSGSNLQGKPVQLTEPVETPPSASNSSSSTKRCAC